MHELCASMNEYLAILNYKACNKLVQNMYCMCMYFKLNEPELSILKVFNI